MEKCNIIGVDINVVKISKVVKIIEENLDNIKGNYICVSNVHTTVMAYENKCYRNIQNSGFMALPDGKPLSVIQKKRGFKEAERVTGPDLMGEIFKISEEKGYTHYFYGSTQKTLDLLKEKLLIRYPKLKIVGMYSPPFREMTKEEDKLIIEEINKAGVDFLWVGLGAPKQEIWMHKHQNRIDALMIGVGAGFDYYAELIKRAPKFMQNLSLEWLYRLLQEPKRLAQRYLTTNVKFIFYYLNCRTGELNDR